MPKHCKAVDPRKVVKINTGIRVADDPAGVRAYEAVRALNGQLEAYWRGLAEGRPTMPVDATSARRFVERMRQHYQPTPAIDLGPNPIAEIARQVALLMQTQGSEAERQKPSMSMRAILFRRAKNLGFTGVFAGSQKRQTAVCCVPAAPRGVSKPRASARLHEARA